MRAYKCNKCNSYFDEVGQFDYQGIRVETPGIVGLLEFLHPNLKYYDELALCPVCAKPLREVLKGWFEGEMEEDDVLSTQTV